jgi:hypothetical protein
VECRCANNLAMLHTSYALHMFMQFIVLPWNISFVLTISIFLVLRSMVVPLKKVQQMEFWCSCIFVFNFEMSELAHSLTLFCVLSDSEDSNCKENKIFLIYVKKKMYKEIQSGAAPFLISLYMLKFFFFFFIIVHCKLQRFLNLRYWSTGGGT